MKRIVCLGGGPAGLYSAILFKKALPNAKVEVYERNRPDDTFGWGVVFSDQTMAGFRGADAPSHDAIVESFHHWDDVDVHFARAHLPQRRSWLLRHRAQAPAQYFSGAGGCARRRADLSAAKSDASADVRRRRSHRRRRRRQQRAARAPRRGVQAPHRRAQVPLHLARHAAEIPGLHLRVREHRAWLVSDPRLSVQQRSLDGHRRDARGDLEGARPRPLRHGAVDRILRAAVRRATSAATG